MGKKKKKNNGALRKVMESSNKIKINKNNERTQFFNGAIRTGNELRLRDVNFITNSGASTILETFIYNNLPSLTHEDEYKNFLMNVLDCFVVRLTMRLYQTEFLVNLAKTQVTIGEDNELVWDFSASYEEINKSPLFKTEEREDAITLFKNLNRIFDTNIYKSHTKDEILKKFYDHLLVFIDGGSFLRSGVLQTNLDNIHLPYEEELYTLIHDDFINYLKRRYVGYVGYVNTKRLTHVISERKRNAVEVSDV